MNHSSDWDTMPFGKYKGEPIADVPSSYLEWLLREVEDRENGFHEAVREELRSRGEGPRRQEGPRRDDGRGRNSPPPRQAPPPPAGVPAERVRASVGSWYRAMSLAYHPDRGGSNEAMKVVNDGYERLKRLLDV